MIAQLDGSSKEKLGWKVSYWQKRFPRQAGRKPEKV